MTTNQMRISRRQFGALTGGLLAAGLARTAFAEEATPQTIVSTRTGEVPTSGGARPGPTGSAPVVTSGRSGAVPTSISMATVGIDAQVETLEIVDGVMQNPTGPWVVSWYRETSRLGEGGNTVMAGHLDYWNVGPAVFYNIGSLNQGDAIDVVSDSGQTWTYTVDWLKNYDVANAPIQEIVGPTDAAALTLITCGGPFDYQNGVYLQRTVVRASLASVN